MVDFYISSTVLGGSHEGTPSNPAVSYYTLVPYIMLFLNSNQDVTVHFTARLAASNLDAPYTGNSSGGASGGATEGQIDMLQFAGKTGTGRLYLDFRRFYNTSDSAPLWVAYTGSRRATCKSIFSQNGSHLKISDWEVDGAKIVAESSKAISICGDNITIKNCDLSHHPSSTNGPLCLVVPTTDGAHEGSSEYGPACDNILIEDNVFHDSYGELVYVGGAGCHDYDATGSAPNCMGFPAHTNIIVRNNKMYNGGIYGGEGDGIDLKAGLEDITITGNLIYNMGGGARAIVMQGQNSTGPEQNILVEHNTIYDCTPQDGPIVLANSWGTPNGITVRFNTITNAFNPDYGNAPVVVYGGTNLDIHDNGPDVIQEVPEPEVPVVTQRVRNMATLDGNISGFVAGDNLEIHRFVGGLVAPLVNARLTVKVRQSQPDSAALMAKLIESDASPSGLDGVIFEPGDEGTDAEISFYLYPDDTERLAARLYYYDIQVEDEDGKIYTPELGRIIAKAQVTLA